MKIFFFIFLFAINILIGQNSNFSQYYAAPLLLNPALGGVDPHYYFGANSKAFWNRANNAYSTSQLTAILPIYVKGHTKHPHKGGVGFTLFNETAGKSIILRNTGMLINGSYNLMLDRQGENMLSSGLQIGMFNKKIDFDDLTWGSQYDPFTGFDEKITPSLQSEVKQNVLFPTVNLGFVWYNNPRQRGAKMVVNKFAGFSLYNLTRPNESILKNSTYRNSTYIKLHGGFDLVSAYRNLTVSPNLYILTYNRKMVVNIGSYFTYKMENNLTNRGSFHYLTLGSWYRLGDSFILSVGYQGERYTFGMSYDSNISTKTYTNFAGAAMELSLSYRILKDLRVKKFSTPLL